MTKSDYIQVHGKYPSCTYTRQQVPHALTDEVSVSVHKSFSTLSVDRDSLSWYIILRLHLQEVMIPDQAGRQEHGSASGFPLHQ